MRVTRPVVPPRLAGVPKAGGPPLAMFVYTIPTEGAPSLRFSQGWAAMLRVLFDLSWLA